MGQNLQIKPYEFITSNKDTVQAERGKFEVLEDRENPDSRKIHLSYVRFKSTNPNPGHPIVYLAGGPGGSGIQSARGIRFDLFMKLREVADVIAFDQRGTGWSNSLPICFSPVNFDLKEGISKEDYLEKSLEGIASCRELLKKKGINIYAYNTTENAKDLDELRSVLGLEKISLWGISYGSHLSFEYMRLFEQNIDKLVLASLEGPNETIKLPKHTEAFIDLICERAKDNYGFSPKYPDLKEKILAVHERIKAAPVQAFYTNKQGEQEEVGISHFELQTVIANFYLKNTGDSRKLPKVYSELYEGNFNNIAEQVMLLKKFTLSRIRPMSFAMDMMSGISDERNQEVKNQIPNTVLGSALHFLQYEWMNTLDFPQLPDNFRTLKENQVKTLLLSGTMDGRTYVPAAQETAKAFKNGKHVLIDNAGHSLFMLSPKIGDLIRDFFMGKEIEISTLNLEPVPFE